MKLKFIKSALFITILTMCNCAGIAMESNNNTMINRNNITENSNTMENANKGNNSYPIFRPIAKRLYDPSIVKRPKEQKQSLLTEEEELKYFDKLIAYVDNVLEQSKK